MASSVLVEEEVFHNIIPAWHSSQKMRALKYTGKRDVRIDPDHPKPVITVISPVLVTRIQQ